MNRSSSVWIVVALTIVIGLGAFSSARAANWWDTTTSTNWHDAANWYSALPDETYPADIRCVPWTEPEYSTGITNLNQLNVGWNWADGTVNITGGELHVEAGTNPLFFAGHKGGAASNTGIVNIFDGLLKTTHGRLGWGNPGTGIVNISGGIYENTSLLEIGFDNGATGIINISGTGQLITTGTVTFDGGTATGFVNFLPDTTGSWTYPTTGNYAYFKSLYDGDDLYFNGTNSSSQPFDAVFMVTGNTLSLQAEAVPEPSAFVLAAAGLLGLGFVGWGRPRKRET